MVHTQSCAQSGSAANSRFLQAQPQQLARNAFCDNDRLSALSNLRSNSGIGKANLGPSNDEFSDKEFCTSQAIA